MKDVLVLRASDAEGRATHRNFQYPAYGPVVDENFRDSTSQLGYGLHGLAWGRGDWSHFDQPWNGGQGVVQVVQVPGKGIVRLANGKVKFHRGVVVYTGNLSDAMELIHRHQPGWLKVMYWAQNVRYPAPLAAIPIGLLSAFAVINYIDSQPHTGWAASFGNAALTVLALVGMLALTFAVAFASLGSTLPLLPTLRNPFRSHRLTQADIEKMIPVVMPPPISPEVDGDDAEIKALLDEGFAEIEKTLKMEGN